MHPLFGEFRQKEYILFFFPIIQRIFFAVKENSLDLEFFTLIFQKKQKKNTKFFRKLQKWAAMKTVGAAESPRLMFILKPLSSLVSLKNFESCFSAFGGCFFCGWDQDRR